MPPRFIKFHGFGNDYIVIESADLARAEVASTAALGEFARRICNRHYGAGADGIAVVSPSEVAGADFRVRIFNPDGSEASLSGNGTRCAAAYLYYQQLWSAEELRLTTRAGIKLYTLLEASDPTTAGETPAVPAKRYVFDSELGQPKFDSASIPMITERQLEKVIDYALRVDGQTFAVTALQMGNPNCCIFVEDFDSLDWRKIGRTIENHKQFPERTNVVFVRVENRNTIELRIWERGVGETEASGTCSCAAAVAAMVKGATERLVTVLMPGGQASIRWRGDSDDGEVVITGTAEVIYGGDWLGR
ncbi:MAG TPA: diaminopimelate epimerase [Pyrinomonadaceae bacterium]|jgi:diaminopimelate epimerase|nr:diaminopimelate epimerase [Pyrinomonadaceae bacterium]